jgi:hypothetical protein
MIKRTAATLLALASPVAAAAQDVVADEAAKMAALAAATPAQPWYPDGYYDIRVAAEAQVAEFPRPATALPETSERSYNLVACDAERTGFDMPDPLLLRYGNVALETARLRAELGRLNYPPSITAAPLLAFERQRIDAADDKSTDGDPYDLLADTLEAARIKLQPGLSPVFAFHECTPPPTAGPSRPRPAAARPRAAPSVVFGTQPATGTVLMISAFAFKLCVRKQPDPWDQLACRWNEIETGVAKSMSGRFVYQVRWPDGVERKGTREIMPTSSRTPVTFKKVGS